jgi:hypothetical protein
MYGRKGGAWITQRLPPFGSTQQGKHRADRMRSRRKEKNGREAKLGPLAGVAKQNGMANGTSPMAWLDPCIYSEKWNGAS